ncbi:MAG: FadR family transcriptional regulator [Steroidobacteraceae bacterium]|nr:FadR family transcriptional regulator [Steroidobacteraceae bacterium]
MFEQIHVEPAYRKVAAVLIGRITDRSLAAGDRLPSEMELARQFGVNRSTVREAMRELESAGLVARQRGSKLMVITRPEHQVVAEGVSRALALHDATYFHVWEALTFLEPPIAHAAAERRQAADIEALRETAAQLVTQGAAASDAVRHVEEYFRRLATATHNPALCLAQEPLLQLLAPSLRAVIDVVPQARARIVTAQGRILDAVGNGNAELAANWMAKHVRDFRKGYEVADIALDEPIARRSL